MEKEGLIRSIRLLKKKKFKIETLVTDRHKQISKWIRENMTATSHYYDIWHMAKCKLDLFENINYISHTPPPPPYNTCTHEQQH